MEDDKVDKFNNIPPITTASDVPLSSSKVINFTEGRFEFLRRYPSITSPVYELHDFTGKIRPKRFTNRFRSSLSSINEVVYRDFGTLVLKSNQTQYLCKSVLKNELGFVRTLLDEGVPPNCFDEHKRTPLHLAVSKGHCEMVQLLLDKGADPNMKDGLGNSCLHLSACTNNVKIASILIQGGASVDAVDIRGRSPVQLAQSKLRILQQSRTTLLPMRAIQARQRQFNEIVDMLVLYLEKGSKNKQKNDETELLSSFQKRLQISDKPEELSHEIDDLRKVLDQMETLSLSLN